MKKKLLMKILPRVSSFADDCMMIYSEDVDTISGIIPIKYTPYFQKDPNKVITVDLGAATIHRRDDELWASCSFDTSNVIIEEQDNGLLLIPRLYPMMMCRSMGLNVDMIRQHRWEVDRMHCRLCSLTPMEFPILRTNIFNAEFERYDCIPDPSMRKATIITSVAIDFLKGELI